MPDQNNSEGQEAYSIKLTCPVCLTTLLFSKSQPVYKPGLGPTTNSAFYCANGCYHAKFKDQIKYHETIKINPYEIVFDNNETYIYEAIGVIGDKANFTTVRKKLYHFTFKLELDWYDQEKVKNKLQNLMIFS